MKCRQGFLRCALALHRPLLFCAAASLAKAAVNASVDLRGLGHRGGHLGVNAAIRSCKRCISARSALI